MCIERERNVYIGPFHKRAYIHKKSGKLTSGYALHVSFPLLLCLWEKGRALFVTMRWLRSVGSIKL